MCYQILQQSQKLNVVLMIWMLYIKSQILTEHKIVTFIFILL